MKELKKSDDLAQASEGCFNIEQHFLLTDTRMRKLLSLSAVSEIDGQALLFVGKSRSRAEKS